MTRLTTLVNGMSSTDFKAAINNNFTFLNTMVSVPATITTIATQEGQSLLNVINTNFSNLVAKCVDSVSLTSLTIGITGAVLNSLFSSINNSLGKAADGNGYFVEYYYSTLHYCTTRRNKILAFDDVDTISLSLDGGLTFPYSKQIAGMESMINFSYIFDNGNILFCTHTKAYYSTDNLTTVNESTVLGIDGQPHQITVNTDNFRAWDLSTPVYINGVEILVWGKATINASNQDLNVWETFDGTTIKSVFKFGVTLDETLVTGDIANINYQPIDNSFWMQVGNGNVNNLWSYWIKGTRNMNTGIWAWERMTEKTYGAGNSAPEKYIQSNGMVFWGDYVYWNCENTGVCRCLYSDITDKTKYELMFDWNAIGGDTFGIAAGENDEIITSSHGGAKDKLATSIDGINFKVRTLSSESLWPDYNDRSQSFGPFTPKMNGNWYRVDAWSRTNGDGSFLYLHKGPVLMMRIVR